MQDLFLNNFLNTFPVFTLILIAIFLPFRQADLTASALLQGIRGEGPQRNVITSEATW